MTRSDVLRSLFEQYAQGGLVPEEGQGEIEMLLEEGKNEEVEEKLRDWASIAEAAGNPLPGYNRTLADAV
jgi:hypothetical protein